MRKVRVGSLGVARGEYETLEASWEAIRPGLEFAASQKLDLLVLPEALNLYRWGLITLTESCADAAVEVPGPQVEMFLSWAAEAGSYLVLPVIERHDGVVRNSAVLIDRKGEVVGRYFKAFPTVPEMDAGIAPGKEAVALQTDFGLIGFAICYDAQFPDLFEQYGRLGIRLLCYSSMWAAGSMLNAPALQWGYYVLTSYAPQCRLIDPAGRDIAEVGNRQDPVRFGYVPPLLVREIDVDVVQVHLDDIHPHLEALLRDRSDEVSFELFGDEDLVLLRTLREDLSPLQVLEELGLPTRRETLARARERRDKAAK